MVENQLRFTRESRRDSEKLGGTWREEWWERWERWERWEGWGASRTGKDGRGGRN